MFRGKQKGPKLAGESLGLFQKIRLKGKFAAKALLQGTTEGSRARFQNSRSSLGNWTPVLRFSATFVDPFPDALSFAVP